MADMPEFGTMNIANRGGRHDFNYEDAATRKTSHGLTPSQTVGPFFAYGLTPGPYNYPLEDIHSSKLSSAGTGGTAITIEGRVFDGKGMAVHDAVIEILQADNLGTYASTQRNNGFTGFGRMGTGAAGAKGDTRFVFETIKPAATLEGAAPFITVIITMRGMLNHYITRIYFEGDDQTSDPVLQQVPEERRGTLIAQETKPGNFHFDIHMQGENETVFFDI